MVEVAINQLLFDIPRKLSVISLEDSSIGYDFKVALSVAPYNDNEGVFPVRLVHVARIASFIEYKLTKIS